MSEISVLESLVVNWAKERKIVPNATVESQLLKAVSEMGELADATLKGQDAEMQDAIGDVVVCLINLCALKGLAFYVGVEMIHSRGVEWRSRLRFPTPGAQVTAAVFEIGKLARFHLDGFLDKYIINAIRDVTVCLNNLCALKGWTLEECVWKAWEQIKDRKGVLLPNGCFVKEEAK